MPTGTEKLKNRPVIVGFGPAGMFCGYMLAMYGYKPIIVERGSKVDQRLKKIEEFWSTGKLDENSNVQFGEGGAGTFSDGKLNTGIKDKENRINLVLKTFVENGAKENILYDAKPHVGTDILSVVVKNMRKYIESKGGTFYFDTEMTDFTTENNVLKAVKLSNGKEIETNICVLAIGHSARDTFEMIFNKGINMEQKPFAIGVRVEHPQEKINKSQYGFSDNRLGAASYKLTYKTDNGRGVYSFCMCPGGFVVPAASGPHQIVVNGMSPSNRGSKWSNSGMVVEIRPEDLQNDELRMKNEELGFADDTDSVLSMMHFQEALEAACWQQGNMQQTAPAQRMVDFTRKKLSYDLPESSYSPGLVSSPLHFWMPPFIANRLSKGFQQFGKTSHGFLTNDAVLIGVETRTSSPVRIVRDNETLQHITVQGLFPCGEGAGYAGGIVSAGIDGERCAEAVAAYFGLSVPQNRF